MRTALTLLALSVVVLLVLVLLGFVRGLERSLVATGEKGCVLVHSVNSEENLENSAIAANVPSLLTASVGGTVERFGVQHTSAELYMGTKIKFASKESGMGLVRGVEPKAVLVRRSVRLKSGSWPQAGEVIVGRLVPTKLGANARSLENGETIEFEGKSWKVSGQFAANGTAYESEIWCNLGELQNATKRQDISLVAVQLRPQKTPAEIQLFCKERTDLELRAIPEQEYYASLQQHYQPVKYLAWLVVFLVTASGVFAGLNMMYGAVAGRVRELATLQAIGFRRSALLASLVQEGIVLSSASSLIAATCATWFLDGLAVRFTMGAFDLQIDSIAILTGFGVGLSLGVLGALPPALKALRMPVAVSLKAV